MNLPLGPPRKTFGSWLRQRRQRRNKTITQVAVDVGMSIGRIKRVESGYDRISPFRLFDFAAAYGVSFDQMLDEVRILEPKLYEEFRCFEDQLSQAIKSGSGFGRQFLVNLSL